MRLHRWWIFRATRISQSQDGFDWRASLRQAPNGGRRLSGSARAINVVYRLTFVQSTDEFRFGVSNNGTAIVNVDSAITGAVNTAQWYFVVCWHDATADTINISVDNGTASSVAHTTGIHQGSGNSKLDGMIAATSMSTGMGLLMK